MHWKIPIIFVLMHTFCKYLIDIIYSKL